MKKRIGSVLIAVMMVLTIMPAMAFAESSVVSSDTMSGNGWQLDSEGVLTCTGKGEISSFKPFLPKNKVKKVVIEDGITSIGKEVFKDCTNLTSVSIPEGVTIIYEYAFSGCSSLTTIDIPEGMIAIGDYAFADCTSLMAADLPDSVKHLGDYAFTNCSSLTTFTMPEDLSYFAEGVFMGCSNLETVTIDYGIVSFNAKAFLGCSSLTTFNFGKNVWVNWLAPWAFQGCSSLKELVFTNLDGTLSEIGRGAFYRCSSLETVNLSKKLNTIAVQAFEGCSSLTSLYLYEGVYDISAYAFDKCEKLTIYGVIGSYAHYFATENNIPFACQSHQNIEVIPAVEPTCATVGKTEGEMCSDCGMIVVEQEEIPTLAHTPGPAATCTTAQKCIVCNAEMVAATGHKYGNWIVEKAATCIENGSKYKECICGDIVTETLPAFGHAPGAAATCTIAQVCTVCGTELTPATGHKPGAAATCTTAQTCTVCNEELAPATGHSEVEDVAKPATTKATGLTAGSHCETCDEVFVAQTTIPKIKTVTLKTSKYTYDGKAKKPAFTVKDADGNVLEQDTDYIITYTNSNGKAVKTANVGTYKAIVTFQGDYSGTVSKQFVVNPKAPVIKAPVAAKKALTAKWGKVAKQATGYEVMVATNSKFTKGKKTVKVTSFKTTSKKVTNLKAKTKYYVKVRTYTKVSGKTYYSAWSKVKTVKTK